MYYLLFSRDTTFSVILLVKIWLKSKKEGMKGLPVPKADREERKDSNDKFPSLPSILPFPRSPPDFRDKILALLF
jgi:hypothetical protein